MIQAMDFQVPEPGEKGSGRSCNKGELYVVRVDQQYTLLIPSPTPHSEKSKFVRVVIFPSGD